MRKLAAAAAFALIALSARAEQKNVKLLTGMSDLQLQRTMNLMRASLGVHCDFCHVRTEKGWDFPSEDKKEKQQAREMITLVKELNERNFHGRPVVNCNTCHNGQKRPAAMVSLPQAVPPLPTPVVDHSSFPKPEDLLARHIAAIGGEAAVKRIRSAASVDSRGVRLLNGKETPITVRRTADSVRIQYPDETQTVTADGGSVESANEKRAMNPSQVENILGQARDFDLYVPALGTTALTLSKADVDGHEAWIVATVIDEHHRQRLYFDAASGLLVRRITLADGPIGQMPEQIDYSDYRDAGGAKVPYTVRVSLVDPWVAGTRKYSEVKLAP